MDQFYRSTMAIYQSIMEQFNPALENLVYLGNNYLRAFHALAEAAEVYFEAIQKIGEQALQSSTSQMLGEILVQMSDTQRHLNSDLEIVVQTFHGDVLQHMEKNTKLDMQFIQESRQHYELEYRHRAAHLEKCMSELWRMERTRDKNAREMKESVNRLHAQMRAFVTDSQRAAELEQKRRYRFLAEKHLLLSGTFLQFYGRARGLLQNRVILWKEQSEASRNPSGPHSQGLRGPSPGPGYPSGRLPPTHLEMPQRPLGDFSSPRSRHTSGSYTSEPVEARPSAQLEPDRRSLPRTPSASSLFAGNQQSRSNSLAENPGSPGGPRRVRALVSHSNSTNHTLLRFAAGDVIAVLVPEAQNGWLYGKLDGTGTTGWFPEAYVKPLEDANLDELSVRCFPLRGSRSLDNLLDRPDSSAASPDSSWGTPAKPRALSPPPALPIPNSSCSSVGSLGGTGDAKKLMAWEQPPPELFPRGTNPFATVKLRPTVTNDRSAPVIR
ncbi:brain-specific angiogenesis inhibitor 1-associated protein 2-like protein 2 [Tachyglossus aculeatus]|uniref:brain-specific angiogenesis inhibitor 1-associated protein 2-like protein 2 n=1 Tax=Tachyglossus aculeatus TaxID=9261 RepID=UPI0018F4485E|nr:brain-specific angiogenesis inhibitor 1-associated protein 2-like protein 2 [Tachyglossus aculeatus]